MKTSIYILGIICTFLLTSCIEIIDDLSFNEDGSGVFKYNINLSSSKVKINSILALDSLDGKPVPKLEDIKQRVNDVVEELKVQEGITSVELESDYDEYMFKLKCEFESLEHLQSAIKTVVRKNSGDREIPELEHNWASFENNSMVRSVPQITIKKTKEINQKDVDLLKKGSYTSITRFDREISEFENENALVSKNKKAIMLRTDPYSLTQDPNILDNSIHLVVKDE
jgi:hypothetical protein